MAIMCREITQAYMGLLRTKMLLKQRHHGSRGILTYHVHTQSTKNNWQNTSAFIHKSAIRQNLVITLKDLLQVFDQNKRLLKLLDCAHLQESALEVDEIHVDKEENSMLEVDEIRVDNETMEMLAPSPLHRKVVAAAHKAIEDLDGEVAGALALPEH